MSPGPTSFGYSLADSPLAESLLLPPMKDVWSMLSRILILLAGLHLFAASGAAQDAEAPAPGDGGTPTTLTEHRTGAFRATLPDRAPQSERAAWIERFQFPGDLEGWDYDLGDETFSLYIPAEYDPEGEPYGVVVWISPSEDGAIPARLRSVFDERRLIWIGANDAGNSRHLFHRSGLALDAATNVKRLYNVDPGRVFVSGLSGGGRVAAMDAVDFPDVFSGGLPIIGVTTYLDVPLESNPGQRVLQFPEPSADVLEQAREQPLVIMTGSGDFNREECRLAADAYRGDGFTRVEFLKIEGMGHEMPSPDAFGRGLDLLLETSP